MIKQRQNGRFPLISEARIQIETFGAEPVVPYRPGPVIVNDHGKTVLTAMRYSLLPSWSKEPKVKFATHNARLESIDTKPTWKSVFVRRHCLVPLSEFIEPIYEGEHAGYMVAFGEKNGELFYAAGVWDEWTNRTTGEVIQTYAIITSDPPPFVAQVGHDRCPVFLNEANGRQWLDNTGGKPAELKSFLSEQSAHPDFTVERFRAMRPGWEKRK